MEWGGRKGRGEERKGRGEEREGEVEWGGRKGRGEGGKEGEGRNHKQINILLKRMVSTEGLKVRNTKDRTKQ